MAKKTDAEKKVEAGFKLARTGPARKRRNSFQRKCLSKAMKRMFASNVSSVRAMLLSFERHNKARTTA